jgi:hypothetical protein
MQISEIFSSTFETELGDVILLVEANCFFGLERHESRNDCQKFQIKLGMLSFLDIYEFLPSFSMSGKQNSVAKAKGWAFLIRNGDGSDLQIKITCKLENRKSEIDWGLDTGENLDALLIEKGNNVLSIGTEGAEMLRYRAEVNNWMPTRLVEEWGRGSKEWGQIVGYEDFGLMIKVPSIRMGERMYFHIICASGNRMSKDDISTNIMVDQLMEKVLNKLRTP